MIPSSRPPRTPRRLSAPLQHRLNTYALVASAAGVSVLALAQPSEARIVYTKTHKVIGTNGLYPLDLNHDGTIDFLIQQQGYPFGSSGNNGLGAKEAFGNAVGGSNRLASALKKGAPVGPRQLFISSTASFGAVLFNAACSADSGCSTIGKWGNVHNRYLGLKFKIHGKIHYGWARLSVEVQSEHKITATLTGYAYETIAKKEIHAGQTQSADDALTNPDTKTSESAGPIAAPASRTLQPASLGQLARGTQYVQVGNRP
jgi:hypothetical protein